VKKSGVRLKLNARSQRERPVCGWLAEERKLNFQCVDASANGCAYTVNEFPARKASKMFVDIGASFDDTVLAGFRSR